MAQNRCRVVQQMQNLTHQVLLDNCMIVSELHNKLARRQKRYYYFNLWKFMVDSTLLLRNCFSDLPDQSCSIEQTSICRRNETLQSQKSVCCTAPTNHCYPQPLSCAVLYRNHPIAAVSILLSQYSAPHISFQSAMCLPDYDHQLWLPS